ADADVAAALDAALHRAAQGAPGVRARHLPAAHALQPADLRPRAHLRGRRDAVRAQPRALRPGGRARPLRVAGPPPGGGDRAVPLGAESPLLVLALVEARFPAGTHETYQVPLGLRPAADGWDDRVIMEADGWTVYDALADAAHGRELLHRMRAGSEVPLGDQG